MGSIFPNDEAHKRLMESGKELQKSIDAGIKHDAGKPSLSLIDKTALVELARVLDFGAKKYAAHNWRGGIKWSRILDSAMRHLQAFNDGEDLDPETGLSHVAHAMCNCMFLLNYIQNHKELDDRYKKDVPVSPLANAANSSPLVYAGLSQGLSRRTGVADCPTVYSR